MKTIFSFIILCSCFMQIRGQSLSPQVISSGGNTLGNASVQVDWTLGQVANQTLEGPGSKITQGFEQPNLLITSIAIPSGFENVRVYPNPASSSVWIEFPADTEGRTEIVISDLIGREISRQIRETGDFQIQLDVSSLSPATYFLKLCNPNNLSFASFKIIKIN